MVDWQIYNLFDHCKCFLVRAGHIELWCISVSQYHPLIRFLEHSETQCCTREMFHDFCLQKEIWKKTGYSKLWVTVTVSKHNCWHVLYFGWRRQGTRPSHGKEPRYLFSRALFVFLMGFKSESLWMPVIFNCSLHEVHLTYDILCTLYVIFMSIFVDIHPSFVQCTCKTSFLSAGTAN